MADIYHIFGYDLNISESGDLESSDSSDSTKQRILRRLCTNSEEYIFSLNYGAGLPLYVGDTKTLSDIRATVLQQMNMESGVSSNPQPSVSIQDFGYGKRKISIIYSDSNTDENVSVEL